MFPVNLNQNSEPGVVTTKSIVSGSDSRGKREHVLRDLLQADLVVDDQQQIQGFMPVGGISDKPISIAEFFEPPLLELVTARSNIAFGLRNLIFNSGSLMKHKVITRTMLVPEYDSLFADEEAYTEWGKTFRDLIKGKDFIDFCSQVPNYNFFPGLVADKFGAKSYTAIDLDRLMENRFNPAKPNSCPHISFQTCLLSFIRKMKVGVNNRVFFFSGVENASSFNTHFIKDFHQRLGSLSKPGDILIFDDNTSKNLIWDLQQYGFKPKLESPFDKIIKFSIWEKV